MRKRNKKYININTGKLYDSHHINDMYEQLKTELDMLTFTYKTNKQIDKTICKRIEVLEHKINTFYDELEVYEGKQHMRKKGKRRY